MTESLYAGFLKLCPLLHGSHVNAVFVINHVTFLANKRQCTSHIQMLLCAVTSSLFVEVISNGDKALCST